IDLTAPTISVSAPDNTNDSTPTITGTTDAPVGSTVTLVVSQGATSQTLTATVQAGGTYSATVPTALAEGGYTVTASVTDAAGNTGHANDPGSINISPVTANVFATGNEDPASPIAIALTASDTDGSIDHYVISTLPANGVLFTDVAMTHPITIGQSVAGPVYFMPASNWSGNTSFNYAAVDNNGVIDSTPAQASVTVTPVADMPTLQIAMPDLFVLTPGNTVISTGATDREIVPGPTDYEIGSGVKQSNLEAELGLATNYLDNRFNPVGPGVTDDGFVDIIDGKLTESNYAMTTGMTVTWNYAFKNGEDLLSEVAAGYNDVVVLLVTDPLGNKQSFLVDASEEKFPAQISNGTFSFTATMPGTYTFDWLVMNSGDTYKDSSLSVNKPQFTLSSHPGQTYAAPVDLGTLAALTDTDGSETLAVTIANVPAGAAFTAGTPNADGSVWTFTAAQLAHLELLPPSGYTGTMDLLVTATSTENANHATASTSQHLTIGFGETTTTYSNSTEAAQSLTGTSGNDLIRGYAGNDTISGGSGHDIIYGGAGNDTVQGDQGNDNLYGGVGTDSLSGGADHDKLYGGSGNDILDGGTGNDLLAGGQGSDNLTGGLGSDVFQWSLGDAGSAGTPAVDTIADFAVASRSAGGDVLDLRDLLQGEHSSLSSADHLGNLTNYLHFTVSGDTTTVQISTSGGFAGGFNASAVDQQIVLSHADLSAGGLTTDQLIIQDLLSKGKLLTD
ncbi:MAG: type I secretion C-terminal target domain-containing protein, partial [Candidatus Accumulibacter sp.]|nr:type I secretion C-terminal target domain-containing protein [Accumulibacter sp.]